MNETEFINSDIQPNAYYMHEQLKENNYSFTSFLLLAAVCVEQYIAFSDIFFSVDEGKGRDARFSSYSLSNTGEALFPYVSRCLIFWYS